MKAQLNIDADISINSQVITLSFALYINNFYSRHRPDHYIRVASHPRDT